MSRRGLTELPAQDVIEGAERRLVEIAAVFDEPVAPEPYPLALLTLGHRLRTLFQAFLELQGGAVPVAGRALVRPMVEINILVRFLRKAPDLHTALWQAESDRNIITINDEVRASPFLRATLGRDPLSDAELKARTERVVAARKRAREAGLAVERGSVLPSVSGQLKVIDERAAYTTYTTSYRLASWDVHTGHRTFRAGTFSPSSDGRVSYEEDPKRRYLLWTRLVTVNIVASTNELIGRELRLEIEHQADEIIRFVGESPPEGADDGDS